MIRSRVLRWVLVAVLLTSAAIFLMPDADDPPHARAAGIVLAALCLLFVAGLTIPWRNRLLLRVACGLVSLAYVGYFVAELAALMGGEPQRVAWGEPSALMANLALLLIALPMGRYAVTGRTGRERKLAVAAAADPSGELADRIALAAMADAGIDLTQETDVTFDLEFPSAAHAESAALVVRREGDAAEVVAADDATHVCRVHRRLIPAWEPIRAARARYESLARELGGRLGGWESERNEK